MKLRDFPLLTDEDTPRRMAAFLRQGGFDVLDVREQGWDGTEDLILIRRAHAQGRVVVTHDRGFGRLAIRDREPLTGILYIRPGHLPAERSIEALSWLLSQPLDLRPGFILVLQRKRRGFRFRLRFID